MPMRPEQIEQAQTLIAEVQKIRDAHAEVITGDFSVRTITDDNIFDYIDNDAAYERIRDVIANELATSFQKKIEELKALEVDTSEFKLSQLSDYR
ncbi:MAG: hypothetical protein ACM31O_14860 [Bacteroidota bacterium]